LGGFLASVGSAARETTSKEAIAAIRNRSERVRWDMLITQNAVSVLPKATVLESLTIIAANGARDNFYSDKCAYENSTRRARQAGSRGCGNGLEKSFSLVARFSD
jgi:hypothetical protein